MQQMQMQQMQMQLQLQQHGLFYAAGMPNNRQTAV